MASSGLKKNKLIFLTSGILMVLIFVGTLTLLKNVYQTETYYVLNTSLATRSQISPELLAPVTTTKGTAPKNALRPADVQSGQTFTRIPLEAGDILTNSNTGGLDDISVGLPDSWVVTSFPVPADDASAGRIRRGYYFDMMVTTENGVIYPFINMLALDTTTSLNSASNSNAINTDEARQGQSQIYYVGLTPANAAILQDLVNNYAGKIRLILTPRQNEYQAPDVENYTGEGVGGAFRFIQKDWTPQDMSGGTDNTFTKVERDELGRPKDRDTDGNVKYPTRCGNNSITNVKSLSECDRINPNSYPSATSEGAY